MGNIERWTIYPSRWFGEGRDRSLALGRVEPRPATDSEPFEVVRADAYLGVVDALREARDLVAQAYHHDEDNDSPGNMAFAVLSAAINRFGGQ